MHLFAFFTYIKTDLILSDPGVKLTGFASQFAMKNSRVCEECTATVALVCDERIKQWCNRVEASEAVITACMLYLTLPVTVASTETSVSKLNLIKTYLCQVWQSSHGMLRIDSQRLNDLRT